MTWYVTHLTPMTTPRDFPGVICISRVCYVFGGKSENNFPLTSSDKYLLHPNH